MDKKADNHKKKEFLRKYRKRWRKVSLIEAQIDEIRQMKISLSSFSDGMPRGNLPSDLSAYVAKLDEMERELIEAKKSMIRAYSRIMTKIDALEDEDERGVLIYRYIKGLPFWEIADLVGISESTTHRKHGTALEKLRL